MEVLRFELRQIDAWMDFDDMWMWNQSFHLADVFLKDTDDEKKAMYKALKKHGVVFNKGKVMAEFDGDCWTVIDRKTKEPLFALVPCYA